MWLRISVVCVLACACSSRPAPVRATPTSPPRAPADAAAVVPDAPRAACSGEDCYRGGLAAFGNDPDGAVAMLDEACVDHVPDACRRAAAYRAWGYGNHAFDPSAVKQLEEMCTAGDQRACRSVATMRDDGGGGFAADPVAARAEYERICKTGESGACLNLAIQLQNGTGGAKDMARAATLYREQCSAGDQLRCFEFATLGHQPLPCLESGYALSCEYLGDLYDQGVASCGRGFPCAFGLRIMACMGGDRNACQKCRGANLCDTALAN